MKKILTIAGVAAVLATPAFANDMTKNSRAHGWTHGAAGSYASAERTVVGAPGVWQGDYETWAQDPDFTVRLSLQRDNPTGAGQ